MASSSTEKSIFAFQAHPSLRAFTVSPPVFLQRHFPPPGSNDTSRPPAPVFLATGAIVFDRPIPSNGFPSKSTGVAIPAGAGARHGAMAPNPKPPRVLLIQRAAHDSMALRWETPGGGCDDDDTNILHSCARELFEEAGLHATTLGPVVRVGSPSHHAGDIRGGGPAEGAGHEWGEAMGGQFFRTRKGKLVCKFYFIAEVPQERTAEVVVDPKEHIGYVWATEEEVKQKKVQGEAGLDLKFTTPEQWEVILTAFKLWDN